MFVSSGDLTADRRFEWARDLAARGDLAAAADLLAQALELVPAFGPAWFALGDVNLKLGQRTAAVAAFERARMADPTDAHGAAVRLAQLGAAAPAAMPDGYIRALFDGYAPGFDAALRDGLGYRAPELLLEAVRQVCGPQASFAGALDLGCGTGLAGEAFRLMCRGLTGVDLSPAMLAQARRKNIYDRLVEAEVISFLAAEAATGASYGLIAAADVFVYLHDLAGAIAAAGAILNDSGVLVFSVETHDGDGVVLRDTLRFAHSATCVREAIASSGLVLQSLEHAVTRTEKGAAVPGLIAVARR
jgi:predicted TPR repeat methyltransferase